MKNIFKNFIIILLTFASLFTLSAEEISLNAIVATVDGKPITLQEINKKLGQNLTFQQAAKSAEAKDLLDKIINERLIKEEAKLRRIIVQPEEVERYIERLAEKNQLSREGFEEALREQKGISINNFKKETKIQILKSKVANELVRGSAAVTDKEIDEYFKEHSELQQNTRKIKLNQILFLGTTEDVRLKAYKVRLELTDPDDFEDYVKKYSELPSEAAGGLDFVDEKDLEPAIFDAVFSLKVGEISNVVQTEVGFHIFKVENREIDNDQTKAKELRAEIEQILKQEKLESKLQEFFNVDLFTNHFVDRKI